MPNQYVVRPKTGEVFPPECAAELMLTDHTLRIATAEEQREIVAGRDFRLLYHDRGESAPLVSPERFRKTDAFIPVPERSPHDPSLQPAAQVAAGVNASMEVQLGRIPAGQPNPLEVPPDGATSEHVEVPLAEQLEAIEAIEDLDALRATADSLGAEWKPTMNRDTLRMVLKKHLIAKAAGTLPPAA